MNRIYVVDAEGLRMRPPRPRDPVATILNNQEPSEYVLSLLEDAIYQDGVEKRTIYLNKLRELNDIRVEDLDDYLVDFEVRKRKALRIFWEKGWTPSPSGNKVLDVKVNPYVKDIRKKLLRGGV